MRRVIFTTLLLLSTVAPAALAADPAVVFETAERLDTRRLDTARAFVADGQALSRDGIDATFQEGRFLPLVRDDGRVVGLLFEGIGSVAFVVPAGVETASWQAQTRSASLVQAFSAAFLRFTDATLDDLQGDRRWQEAKDPGGTAFRTFESRAGLLEDPLWTRWAPDLVIDQLVDLYGGGHVGGHLLAEFKLDTDGRPRWISYLENPRGALVPGETRAIYEVRSLGGAPPEVDVLASWGSSPFSGPAWDMAQVDLDVTFPTGGRNNRNLVDAVVKANLDIVATRADAPLKAVVFELEQTRLLCTAQSDRDSIAVTRVTDGEGNALGAVQRGSRLLVPLARPVQPGETLRLTVEYAGPMTQGIPVEGRPDTFFTSLGPWAWYPRSVHPDRFGSRIEVHLPRFMRAVAPGDMVEERKEKDAWHFVFSEPSGVRTLVLVVGDLLVTPVADHGTNPKIMVWLGQGQDKDLPAATDPVRKAVDLVSSIWGPFPYTTLHVIETVPYPAVNWHESGEMGGSSWSCVPPGQDHPWQGFVEGGSGIVLSSFPVTVPSRDVVESRILDRMFLDPVEVSAYNRFTDITRQWWGHMVPPATRRDIWITEAMVHWTALLFTRAGIGEGAMKERIQILRAAMVEEADASPPLVLGERLGRSFAPQVWGRGPLLIAWLVERMGARVFMSAMNTLVNRASAAGVSLDLLLGTVGPLGEPGLPGQIRFHVEDNRLPDVKYTPTISKDGKEAVVVFSQDEASFVPVDLTVDVVFSAKEKEKRLVRLDQPLTVFRWKGDKAPSRVDVDPLDAALVRSIRKVQGLEAPAEDAQADPGTPVEAP